MKEKKKIAIEIAVIVIALAVIIGGASLLYPMFTEQLEQAQQTALVPEPTPLTADESAAQAPFVTVAPADTQEAVAQESATPEVAGPVFKRMATDFVVYDAQGNAVSLKDYRGKPVVVNFFASWCGPCKIEMPYFEEFYLAYGDKVEFMMVNLCAFGNDTREAADAMIAEGGYTFPVYYDTDGSATLAYSIRSMPTTIFVSSEGELKGQKIGTIDRETLKKTVEAMAAEVQ